ncbi:hypothetical protein BDZ91DRAFT_709240 [Kalaharituber pfeilii]|nr:hypothetical protein BDZ91DRAFT_709240 [Kalaharituber pfeilii]
MRTTTLSSSHVAFSAPSVTGAPTQLLAQGCAFEGSQWWIRGRQWRVGSRNSRGLAVRSSWCYIK